MTISTLCSEFSPPVHLDFTSVYGAALAIDQREIALGHLPLSRLLSLSQLVESIVIHDVVQYELGSTPDWGPYREALEKSTLIRSASQLGLPLVPYEEQIDSSEAAVLAAARWAIPKALKVSTAPLAWAVRFRSGTYDGVSNMVDAENPMTKRYLEIIACSGESDLIVDLEQAIGRLMDNHVGVLGVHVLMRIGLLESHLVEQNVASYLPHFSRQPLIVATMDRNHEIKRWSIDLVRDRRRSLLAGNDPHAGPDHLAVALSPVFLACLENATSPQDIIEEAARLRNTKEAVAYREECRNVIALGFGNEERLVQEFKVRVRRKLEGLRVILQGDDVKEEYSCEIRVSPSFMHLFFLSAVRRTVRPARKKLADDTNVFLNDILWHAMGIVGAQERLREIYGVAVDYDSDILCWKDRLPSGPADGLPEA